MDRSRHELVLAEDFTGPVLDTSLWVPHYLPHWTTPDRSAARYELNPGRLRLRIDANQPPWRPEDDGLRVSNIQTATYSGPDGSHRATHGPCAHPVSRPCRGPAAGICGPHLHARALARRVRGSRPRAVG